MLSPVSMAAFQASMFMKKIFITSTFPQVDQTGLLHPILSESTANGDLWFANLIPSANPSPSRPIELSRNSISHLHETFKSSSYRNWVNRAPDDWTSDGWLASRIPIIFLSRYGQNWAITDTVAGEEKFHKMLNWYRMRWVSFAHAVQLWCATEICCDPLLH